MDRLPVHASTHMQHNMHIYAVRTPEPPHSATYDDNSCPLFINGSDAPSYPSLHPGIIPTFPSDAFCCPPPAHPAHLCRLLYGCYI